MAELVQLRQRIKTVEAIRKITHAMRLVSMSNHAHVSRNYSVIQQYHAALSTILEQLAHAYPEISATPSETTNHNTQTLIIVIGSEKGLCGSFNTNLFVLLATHMQKKITDSSLIAVGKKATDFIQERYASSCIASFAHLSVSTAQAIAHAITERIYAAQSRYTHVIVFSNAMKSFFVQFPRIITLIPKQTETNHAPSFSADYIWDVDPIDLLTQLNKQYTTSALTTLLIESLLAEHAARFISMDSSTRNAEKILETTQLKYNKLRQAKITKEIIELADSF